jgi:hypothetical protein
VRLKFLGSGPAALAIMLAPLAVTLPACGSGCFAELHLDPVEVQGNGRPRVDLDLSARLTDDGHPVPGVGVEFYGIGPGGVILGTATTDAEGTAHLHATGALGPDSINGRQADRWTAYRVKVSVLQQSRPAADTICAGQADAGFRFVP